MGLVCVGGVHSLTPASLPHARAPQCGFDRKDSLVSVMRKWPTSKSHHRGNDKISLSLMAKAFNWGQGAQSYAVTLRPERRHWLMRTPASHSLDRNCGDRWLSLFRGILVHLLLICFTNSSLRPTGPVCLVTHHCV